RAGLDFRYHDLRHYDASTLIDGGCSVPELQEALGDASAKVMFDTYAHIMPTAEGRIRAASAAAYQRCVLGVSSPPCRRPKAQVRGPRAGQRASWAGTGARGLLTSALLRKCWSEGT
ncbi:MAG: hypothetical protein LC808_13080, partial [Actinobacteria bacterium]|nr:hypothetical protein [Actinomycetota bacterium]